MNIVSSSVIKVWPAPPVVQPPQASAQQASAQATADSTLLPPADSGAPTPADQTAAVASNDGASEVQTYLLHLQEIAPPSVASADGNAYLSNTGNGVDGTTVADSGDNAALLLDGPSAKNMRVSVSGTTAVVSFADGSDPLTLNLNAGSVTLNFADGTIAQIMAQTPARSLEAAVEAESRGVAKMV